MNNIKLKALRQGVGLTVKEASALIGVNKRTFQYWESDPSRTIFADCVSFFEHLKFSVGMVIELMQDDIKIYNSEHGMICTEEGEFQSKLVLPFYADFERFKEETGCPLVQFWRVYQAVISHLLITGWIVEVDDSAKIPDGFMINHWLLDYSHHESEKWEFDRENGEWI